MAGRVLLFFFIFLPLSGQSFEFQQAWYSPEKGDQKSLQQLLTKLSQFKHGRKVIAQAKRKAWEQGQHLIDVLQVGEGSLTDTVLTRHFQPHAIIYSQKSVVYINKHLSGENALLDLIHELTHFTHKEAHNPYTGKASLVGFVRETIEGTGGEVEAFLQECALYQEIRRGDLSQHPQCSQVWNGVAFSKELGAQEFYKVGEHYQNLKQLKNQLPMLSSETSLFISSAYDRPYPVAALQEFKQIQKKSCANDRLRLGVWQKIRRAPASVSSHQDHLGQLMASYQKRCQ